MNKPFISIIVPTLNEEKYLETTLKAIRSQDYQGKYEIIVADGMSKDRTVRIAKKYADKVVRVEKKGPSAGRNAGAKLAKGNILLFVDADTLLLFNGLTEISRLFNKKNVVGVTCPVIPLSHQAKDFAIFWAYNQFSKGSIKRNKAEVAGICIAYRKNVFERVGGFDENLFFSEDIDISRKISKLGKIMLAEKTIALTSTRRFEKPGRVKSVIKHIRYYLKYILNRKSIKQKHYRPIR